jgi:hypothetical protein
MDETLQRFKGYAAQAAPYFRVRPASGKLWLDAVFLLFVGVLHHAVAPTFTGNWLYLDLITPWLVVHFVTQSLPRAALLGAIGALILETHVAAPAGLYFCAYWVIIVTLQLTRSTLSWRHAFPWLVTMAAAQAWVIGFETFVRLVNEGPGTFRLEDLLHQLTRLIAASLIGLLLARRFITGDENEEPS